MEHTPDSLSFGRYLKGIRLQRGISLNAVADEICVGLWLLSLIESEDHERLPDEVYVKGILRAYAKVIGVDPADVIRRYQFNRHACLRSAQAEADLLKSGMRCFPRMALTLGAVLVIACASLAFYEFPGVESDKPVTNHSEIVTKSIQPNEVSASETAPARPGHDLMYLKIDVISETTINVQIDDQQYAKYHLYPNDAAQFEAYERFNLLISDADGVRIHLNDKPVTVPGERGQSVNLVLSKPALLH